MAAARFLCALAILLILAREARRFVTRFWRAARRLRLRPELAHTSDRDTRSHRHDADASGSPSADG